MPNTRPTYVRLRSVVCLALLLGAVQGGLSQQAATQRAPQSQTLPPQAPVYAEALFGNDRLDLQVLINKRFTSTSHAAFLSVTSAQGEHNNSTDSFDFVNVTQLSYDLYRGLGANIGLSLNRQVGFNTTAGLQYVHANPKLLFVLSPAVFLNGDHDLQNVLVLKYQPSVTEKWRLYESVQVFDDYVPTSNIDARRFVHARTGATYRLLTFGFGSDFDWYGLPKSYRTNYGPFLAYFF